MKFSLRHRLMAGACALTLAMPAVAAADTQDRTVGPQANGSIVASDNQTLTPAGTLVQLGSPVRAKAVAVNPIRKTRTAAVLMMAAAQPVIIFDTTTGAVLQRFIPTAVNGASFTSDSTGSFTGITYSPDGTHLYFSQDDNHMVVADVDPTTGLLTPNQSVALPPPPANGSPYYNASSSNPGGIAISADGTRAYVVLNAQNRLAVVDLVTGQIITRIGVGNAPNSVVIKGNYAYVSNEGGRPAKGGDFTNYSDGTAIVVDKVNASATTGTVSVVDLVTNTLVQNIGVGLHPAGMTISGNDLYVANSFSDTVSVIDTTAKKVVDTISVAVSITGGAFGAGPNGVALVGTTAYVTMGQANAIGVFDVTAPAGKRLLGYIPTAYFPTSIAYDAVNGQLVVADDKGIGAQGSIGSAEGVKGFNTHQDAGVVNLIPLPTPTELAVMTNKVRANNHWNVLANVQVGPQYTNPNAAPVAIPAHIGEPSLIKHVFLIIKENRTYDQMLGDVAKGNGDPSLAVFASGVPNQHAFIQRFPLLDNVYAPSRQSADGHPWIVESGSFYSNDILSPDWIRSYPGGNSNDALTYTPKGFLWSAAQAKGLTVKMYGEWSGGYTIAKKADGSAYSWSDFYATALCKEGLAPASDCIVPDNADTESTAIPSAAAILDPHYPSFNLGIPDQYRADYYIPQFQAQDTSGTVPAFTIIWLPDDHTAGTSTGYPYPINYEADNDLALGRIVEAISHGKVWPSTAIFVEEDDAQDGVDHVDGHRMPVYLISPYTTQTGAVVHTTYTAENINRTIEQILGLTPLTQFDLVAAPMFDCFQNTPNTAPFTHIPAIIPLNQGPGLPGDSYGMNTPIQKAWLLASTKMMKNKYDKPDSVDENFLNHVIWYSATNWKRPYPGDSKLKWPAKFVKAAALHPHHDNDD